MSSASALRTPSRLSGSYGKCSSVPASGVPPRLPGAPREAEASARSGEDPKTHRRGGDMCGAGGEAPGLGRSSLLPVAPPWRWAAVGCEGRNWPLAGVRGPRAPAPHPHHLKCAATHSSPQPRQPPQEVCLHDAMLKSRQPHPAPQLPQGRRVLAEVAPAPRVHSPSQQYPRWYHLARL